MAMDDFLDTEVGVAVVATAALLSPRARRYLRRGAVYGVAGALAAGEAVAGAARRIGSDGEVAASDEEAAPAARPRRRAATPAT